MVVDAAGYRERREQALHRQADRGGADALRYGRAVELDADERAGAQGRAQLPEGPRDVETHSEGDEPFAASWSSPPVRAERARAFHVKRSRGWSRAGSAGRAGRRCGALAPGARGEDPTAPTSVARSRRVDVHVADSLSALAFAECRAARGSPTSAPAPGCRASRWPPPCPPRMCPWSRRACATAAYLERAIEAAGLTNATVVHARAEEWADGRGGATTSSPPGPLAALPVLCEYAAPLLPRAGARRLEGRARPTELSATGEAAAADPRASSRRTALVRVDARSAGARDHTICTSSAKIAPTPDRFPAAARMARKRPPRC